ncbi:MAG: ISL3 family transposase [Chloroflexia bacterium]
MALPSSHSQDLLPNPTVLVLDRIEHAPSRFRLLVHTDQEPACPVCGQESRSSHSTYRRCLQDLPWQGMAVQVWLTVGRFRCRNKGCPRKIFCERLPGVTRAYGRQTDRASEIVRVVGYIAGGRPGQRLLIRLSLPTSDDTVLRRVRQAPLQSPATLPVLHLGVDDWAWKKRQNYGTILVNLDLHRVVDLLPDRAAGSFAEWLKLHPEVAVISRDRSGLYAEGARLGAPQAQQVADRFHLVVNLSSTVERVLEERSRQLILPVAEEKCQEPAEGSTLSQPEAPLLPSLTQSRQRRQRRLDLYEQVMALSQAGLSKSAISRQMKIGLNTVRRWLRRDQFPERKPRHGVPPRVTEFAEYLSQRWNEGCHNAILLHGEIRAKGYGGKYSGVARLLAGWRKAGSAKPNVPDRIAPKHAAVVVTRPATQLTEEQQQLLDRLAVQCPEVIPLRKVALEFRTALQDDDSKSLLQWIEKARQSEFGPIVRFAYGLKKDIAAVAAAVDTDWSNGQTEGQINRLKTIKRQMYGRAGFALLRARVLPYCPVFTASGSSP